ncbi:TetR/AcrR family transcriptional regulator [Nannocystis punicea]|jgi:AcrR family transcriptional regulator|uniref:Helix-turn-helix domain containing protein n=1 Tax=Nannocystis punicea TaxID=2995304 RepID=A0ABY7H5L5_9BACT|nr:helix-turn-helix domain-containing protein [Nannocystis poenicansa]WAS94576.1 helix-turn-helix domain containing protein [Nannocystis poenicansa]
MRPRSFTDDELLETARRCFLEHGPSVSTDVIAQELGVSQAALFKRFRTKQELMVRSLMPRNPPWVAEIERGPDERPVLEQMRELAAKIDAFLVQQLPCISVLSAAKTRPAKVLNWEKEGWPGMPAHRALVGWFAQLAAQGRIVAPSPVALATAFSSSLQVPHFMKHALGSASPEFGDDYRDRVVEMFWRGIEPRG